MAVLDENGLVALIQLIYQADQNWANTSATDEQVGGIKTGFQQDDENKKYPVQLDGQGKAYVNVPWESTIDQLISAGWLLTGISVNADGDYSQELIYFINSFKVKVNDNDVFYKKGDKIGTIHLFDINKEDNFLKDIDGRGVIFSINNTTNEISDYGKITDISYNDTKDKKCYVVKFKANGTEYEGDMHNLILNPLI